MYSQQPTLEWARRFQRFPNTAPNKTYMELDKLGNIYVCGNDNDGSGFSDIITIKYNSNGDSVWVRRYDTPEHADEYPQGLAVDSMGNSYVIASSGIGFGATKIVILKYNPSGVLLWEKLYAEPGSSSQSPGDIKLDRQGNIYVCGGYWYSGQPVSGITIKLNPAGDTLWTRRKTASGFEYTENFLAIDSTNNVLIGGLSTFIQTSQRAHLVIKYDPAGNEVWNVTSQRSGLIGTQGLAVDANGNSYLACSRTDYILIKYSPNGSELWEANYNGPGNQDDVPNAIAIDLSGDVYLTGRSFGAGPGSDIATVKFSPNGDTLWTRRFNGSNNNSDVGYSIITDTDNNVYITGATTTNLSGLDYATIKYTNAGTQLWVTLYNHIAINGEDVAYIIRLNRQKDIFVTGYSKGTGSIFDYATIKYSQAIGIHPAAGNNPNKFLLYQNYPNPFNPLTKIVYDLPKTDFVSLTVYDVAGKTIQTLVNENKIAGRYEIKFNAENLPSGVYFYKLTAGNLSETRKMIALK